MGKKNKQSKKVPQPEQTSELTSDSEESSTERAAVVDDGTKHDADRIRVRKQLVKNDEEHMRLFGVHTREYLQMQHEDKCRVNQGLPSLNPAHTVEQTPSVSSETSDYDDSSSPCSQRLERYKHGFTEAVKKKFGRVEQIPQDHPLPMLFGLGEKFLRKISTSEEERGSHAEISQENIRKAAFEDTQFENESQSFGFFSHVLSLPECNQADVFKTGITLDALGALIKMQSLCAAACIMSMQGIRFPCVATSSDSLSSERPLQEASSCDKRPFSESSSSSISSSSSVLKEETGLGLRGRLFDGSDEKKELSEKAGDLVFQNPVLFFVKNAAASVTDALCKTKFWLPENTYTEKMRMFMSCTDDYGRQIQSTLKNRYDVFKRIIYAVLYGDSKIDIRPFPNNRGIHFFLNKEREVASQLLETQDDVLKDDTSKRLGRLQDVKAVVTLACQVASYYLDVKAGNPRLNVTDDYIRSFYEMPHDERVRRLERKGATVYTIGFFIHFMFSTLRVYNDKDTAVHMSNTNSFNTTLAIKEIVLWLICAGQDCNKNNYKIASDAQPNTWIYAPGCMVQPLVSVPGVGISQLDPRNQEALIFVSDILNADDIEEFPVHSRDICRGPHGNRPARFFSGPVYMNGWPSAEFSSTGGTSQKKAKHL